jgi:hypothetical protein
MYNSKAGIKICGTSIYKKNNIKYVAYESSNIIIAETVTGIESLI